MQTIDTSKYPMAICSNDFPFKYSDSYTINPTTGAISLNSPQEIDNEYSMFALENKWVSVAAESSWYVTSYRPEGLRLAPGGTAMLIRFTDVSQTSGDNGHPTYLVGLTAHKVVATISYSQGTYIDKVSSQNQDEFPNNGCSGNYWYTSDGSSEGPGTFVETVYSTNGGAYPENGKLDSYWYVRN